MKPFRRTQVITIMAACAISTGWGQQQPQAAQPTAPPQARGMVQLDQDLLQEQIERAAQKADIALQGVDGARLKMDLDMALQEMKLRTLDLSRDQVWKDFEGINLSQMDAARSKIELLAQDIAPKVPMAPIAPMPAARPFKFNYDSGGGSYESGKSQLNNHNYERAVEIFDKVINAKNPSPRLEGAYYWKAYALNKLGKRDEALATLAELQKQFPQSGWVNDAKALQVEVQQAKGPVSPESQGDEDLKLYAINALMGSDAERAVPLLEALLNNPKMSPRLKERALFVLAQSGSDKAHEIVGRYAKGASNPDLQLVAVEYIGSFRSKEGRQLLADVYASTHDLTVKRAVLRGYYISRDVDHLAAAAKSEQNLELRADAVRDLGNIHDDQSISTLVSLYGSESDHGIKSEILRTLGNSGAVKQLIECARKESDPELKRVAVQRLGQMKSKEALDYIAELLK
jgi:tetratricopeptide (TPR) repeat protein